MKVRAFYPVTLTVDGEEIVIRIKRMNMEEHSDFTYRFANVGTPTISRFVSRKASGPEQDRNEKGEFKISFEALAAERLEEFTPEKRTEYEAAIQADELEAKSFLLWVCEQFVTVERGLLEVTADGKEQTVTEGLDFLRIFGARRDVIQQILEAVQRENEMDLTQKKTWRSPIGSSRILKERPRGRVGKKRKTTAKNAAKKDLQNKEDAALSHNGQSGSMEKLSSNPAPSLE